MLECLQGLEDRSHETYPKTQTAQCSSRMKEGFPHRVASVYQKAKMVVLLVVDIKFVVGWVVMVIPGTAVAVNALEKSTKSCLEYHSLEECLIPQLHGFLTMQAPLQPLATFPSPQFDVSASHGTSFEQLDSESVFSGEGPWIQYRRASRKSNSI